MFTITGSKGFHIKFENGVTVSVQFGGGNYCDNYDAVRIGEEPKMRVLESSDAEVAIWKNGGAWITEEYFNGGDSVAGRKSAADVLGALNWAASYQEEANDDE